jgi:NAD(P)-dependent dehydrogenase (short-subunit alcohol dehydrogenase family)
MKIKDSVALVTGANRGIGRALVRALVDGGARRVYAGVRGSSQLAAMKAAGDAVIPLALDVTDKDQIERAAAQAGDVNLLVNNAGVLSSFSFLQSDLAAIERDIATNFVGPLTVTRAFLPAIERSGGGAVVNLLSIVSFASMPALGGYSATKAAAFSLTQALRAELSAKNIIVHGVFPGPVDTDMSRGFDMPKTSAHAVAAATLAGIERGEEDIFPDPMALQVAASWQRDPKALERQFARM